MLTQRDCFEILGIADGSGPEAIRQAYRDMVRVWHPDRFSHDPRLQKKAEERLRKINLAYEVLRSHFDIETIDPAQAEPTISQLTSPSANPESGFAYRWPTDFRKKSTAVEPSAAFSKLGFTTRFKSLAANLWSEYRSLTWAQGGLLFALLVILFLIVRREAQIDGNGVYQDLTPIGDEPINRSVKKSFPAAPSLTLDPAKDAATGQSRVYGQESGSMSFDPSGFTVGSSRDEVIALQGSPERTTSNSLHFGTSDVYFDELGKVVGWSNGKPRLKVVLRAAAPAANGFFTLGSTADEVVALQGTPDLLTKDSYQYGLSEVNLEGAHVVGWNNAGRNLKVKLLPSKFMAQSYFTIGSTADEVIAAQGTPDRVTKNLYHYGTSYIIFDQGHVAEIINGNPKLKIKTTSSARH